MNELFGRSRVNFNTYSDFGIGGDVTDFDILSYLNIREALCEDKAGVIRPHWQTWIDKLYLLDYDRLGSWHEVIIGVL